jgi:two-component system sensor histidine kinase MprB
VSLRTRIAGVAGLAVALAVLAAAIGLYLAVRSDLRAQIDESLTQRAQGFAAAAPLLRDRGGKFSVNALPAGAALPNLRTGGGKQGPLPRAVQPARFGAASGYVQFVSAAGSVDAPRGQGKTPEIPSNAAERAIAAKGSGRVLSDRTVKGTHLRVLTVGTNGFAGSPRGAVMIARPLTEVDHELGRILLILLVVGVAGIALAAQLVADASHELRTPIASLRANIQTLEDADRLPPAEQVRLREDIVEELDELTALVGDVVELARGSHSPSELQDVRLDEIVAGAVGRTRRRGELSFELELQPTIVRGEAERINRAVSNLLDNARKWSPPGGVIEVYVRDGVLGVRDHGPGFEQDELPKIFERFYRAERARKLPGSGLGLAIVRQAAEAHGGYARAMNAPGGGARLEVSFGPALRLSPDADALAASARE